MKTLASWCSVLLIFGVAAARAQTDDLPRHGVIGLVVGPANVQQPEDSKTNPPTVKTVVGASAGEAAGVRAGDVIRAVDGAPVASSTDFARLVGRHVAGDRVAIELSRGGQEIAVTATLKPRPFEASPDGDVLYRSIHLTGELGGEGSVTNGARRRAIITRPHAPGRYPAVLLVAGLGCNSLDGELGQDYGYGPLLAALMKGGFVTMRVEKSGVGDSEGPPCTDPGATAELEADGYVAGLRALKTYDFVNPDQVFVFAHSLGPLIVSLALPREPVRGVVAADTIGRSWFEYGLENVRRQSALLGESLDQVDDDVRGHERCAHDFYVRRESAEEVAKSGTQCSDMIRSYVGVPGPYMQQVGDINLARQWKQINVPALVIYGASDPVTSADEGRYLAEVINSFHPARARYVELAGMGHDFRRYASQAEFMNRRQDPRPHPYDTDLSEVTIKWLEEQMSTGSSGATPRR